MKLSLRVIVFLCFLGLGGMLVHAQTRSVRFRKTNVCAILRHRSKFDGLLVSLAADVSADGMHGIVLIDKNCPNEGLPLDFPARNADDTVAAFDKVILSSGTPGTAGRHVSASFFGRLQRAAPSGKIYYSLQSVKKVNVTNVSATGDGGVGSPGKMSMSTIGK